MIAQAFANNGAQVYITGRRAEALENAVKTWGAELTHPKGKLVPLTADITDKQAVEQLVQQISQREQYLDILINNAGISSQTQTTEHTDAQQLRRSLFEETADVAEWDRVYRTNEIGRAHV